MTPRLSLKCISVCMKMREIRLIGVEFDAVVIISPPFYSRLLGAPFLAYNAREKRHERKVHAATHVTIYICIMLHNSPRLPPNKAYVTFITNSIFQFIQIKPQNRVELHL